MGEYSILSFCELRAKEVVNVLDGRRLGRITDIVFSCSHHGEVKGIVVPFCRRFFFGRGQEVFVPWQCIKKIGEDVILVDLVLDENPGHFNYKKRRRYSEFENGKFDRHYGGNEHSHNNAKVHSISKDNEASDDDDGTQSGYGGSLKKPNFNFDASPPKKNKTKIDKSEPACDRKCDKCMLFDCEQRWKNH